MDEKKVLKLKVLDKVKDLDEQVKDEVMPKIVHTNQTNPIYRNLAKFHNEKIGDKWSIKDLLR